MERNDKGKHRIIFPAKVVRKKPRGRKRIPGKVKFVTFKRLIQEICKDFNIKYIWYDQMCINQDDKEEKHAEIHQMHHIYRNAYCTIALVPELTVTVSDPSHISPLGLAGTDKYSLLGSQWMKRMWTLEETILSSKIVLIGNSIHCWYHQISSVRFPILRNDFDCDIRTILHYAHARTSTKEHDHVFALANIFPEIMKEITVNYDQDIHDLMIQFYGLLAKTDLSILCFRRYYNYKIICKTTISYCIEENSTRETEYNIPVQKSNLPSWTGVYGEHDYRINYKTSFKNYTVNGKILQVTCAGMTNDQHHNEILDLQSIKDMVPPLPSRRDHNNYWRLLIRRQPQGSMNEKFINVLCIKERELNSTVYCHIATELHNLSHFMSIKKTNLLWTTTEWETTTVFFFGYLTEALEDSTQYVILVGIPFIYDKCMELTHYPVIKKDGDYYKAIGMCHIKWDDDHFFDDFPLEEQTFEIQ
ncbi:hypothetical protein INT45_004626 [Circinella minor]|uniref:Heterokaryon incompatibility domain-containing protein n=1 Tax=Circinella minor TaxID=1195481 RepID=A0A8H7S3C2_9FUNG|nr:hypothetical protein INT45_004626 [Circinella minor]